MTESKFPKRRAFAMQKPRCTEKPEGRRTERQIAADKRRRQERHARGNVRVEGTKTPEKRMAPLAPGRVRITSLIVDELTRALSVILKLDGPADVLMKLFFKSNPKLGMRDRGLIAEGDLHLPAHIFQDLLDRLCFCQTMDLDSVHSDLRCHLCLRLCRLCLRFTFHAGFIVFGPRAALEAHCRTDQ